MNNIIKFISVNVGGHRFIKLLTQYFQKEKADIIALQEIYEVDAIHLADLLKLEYAFVPLRLRTLDDNPAGKYIPWGLATLSRFPINKSQNFFYEGNNDPVDIYLDGKINKNKRSLFYTSIDVNGVLFNIAHTHAHGWREDMENSESWAKFEKIFKQLTVWDDLILCGDFNTPRGQKAFDTLAKMLTDNIPSNIKTTVDGNLHPSKGSLNIVIDGLFTSHHYGVSKVKLTNNVSDHLAISAHIRKLS